MIHSQHTALGLTTVAQALAMIEALFPKKEMREPEFLKSSGSSADLAVLVNFVQQNSTTLAWTKSALLAKQSERSSITVNEVTKSRFVSILFRVAKAQEGVSRQERLFVHQFWSELHRAFVGR